MASADQLKALFKSHLDGDSERFYSVALQVAAHEAKSGHGKLAKELRDIVDEAKGKRGLDAPVPKLDREGNWQACLKCHTRRHAYLR